MAGKNSNYNHKSGGTGFLVTAGIIFLALKGLPGLLLGVVIGAGVGAVASIVGKKLDTTTHNRRDREREAREAEIRLQEETRRRQEEERPEFLSPGISRLTMSSSKVRKCLTPSGKRILSLQMKLFPLR